MKSPRVGSIRKWNPVGVDIWDSRFKLPIGTLVRVIQPQGCPKNGTMSHCYIETIDNKFLGICHINSLDKV